NPITGYGKRRAAARQLDILIYTLIAQRREDEHEHNDVLSMLMSAQNGEEPGMKLTEKQIHDHILTFLAAGHETTAIALVWTFYLLSQHPEVREKLLDEIHSVLADRPPTVEDLARLPYLDWVLNESMRLYPPAWMQMRFVAKDIELDGVPLPKGTLLMLSQWVIHRLPDVWEDPEVFRPERWDPANGQSIRPGAYFPFGGGPRICIGMPFAEMEARLILTTILQHYTPQTVPGYRPGLKPTITLRPKRNLRVTLLPTASNASAAEWKQLIRVPDAFLSEETERKGCRNAILGLFRLSY
ncbi:MAG: cytochrome P450, partial [Ktedonobacteraceae bacterium]